MKAKTKTKLCWNCEGSVAINQENCPYCSVYLSPPNYDESSEEEVEEISPPYRMTTSKEDQQVPASPFSTDDPQHTNEEPAPKDNVEALAAPSVSETDMKAVLLPLTLLLAGSVTLLFGVIMLLFSNQTTLTLQWNGSYWFAWMLSAVPLLFFGWKTLQKVTD